MADRTEAGVVTELSPGIRRVIAPNPSPMTHWGTNTYLVGQAEIAVIDPGPDDPAHLAALTRAIGTTRVAAILVTHAHLDHSPLARPLARATGAPILSYGPAEAGRRPVMQALAAAGLAGGGEGVDRAFRPDACLGEGDRVQVDGAEIEALHSPGHMASHLVFRLGETVFSGDHVMDWATTLISPPDGDVAAFMEATRRLGTLDAAVFHPGHGRPVADPGARTAWLLEHRRTREAEILTRLGDGPATPGTLARQIYTDIPPALLPAAARNVFAHLVDLFERKRVSAAPDLAETARFTLI